MARKVFLSILGTGFYERCRYVSENFTSKETKFAQAATLEKIGAKKWSSADTILFIVTEKAKKENWEVTERFNNRTEETEKYNGLKQAVKKMNLKASCKLIDIPDGKNEEEMWEIFSRIYNQLQDKDELYIDLTHSFRYLPMLLLVLSNYAKFLKNIKIMDLSYGNFEARDKATNEAPIVNLLPIAALQDWTFAAADYLENGNATKLKELSDNTVKPILREKKGEDKSALKIKHFVNALNKCIKDFQTCRGIDIISGKNIKNIYQNNPISKEHPILIKPLEPLIEKVNQAFEPFDSKENINNGFAAAQWCYNNGLYQQAITILRENVVSFFSKKHQLNIKSEQERQLIVSVFYIYRDNNIENKNKWQVEEKYKDKLQKIIQDEFFADKDIQYAFNKLTDIRNDVNHNGMRKQSFNFETIRKHLEQCLTTFTEKLLPNNVN